MSTDAEIAWAAGIFEGEGSIIVGTPNAKGIMARALVVSMTDLDVLERVQAILGGTIYGPEYRENRKPIFRWRVARYADIIAVLDLIQPWLGERRVLAAERMRAAAPQRRVRRYVKTTCVRGHPLVGVGANVHIDKRGGKVCRICAGDRRDKHRGSGVYRTI